VPVDGKYFKILRLKIYYPSCMPPERLVVLVQSNHNGQNRLDETCSMHKR